MFQDLFFFKFLNCIPNCIANPLNQVKMYLNCALFNLQNGTVGDDPGKDMIAKLL